MCYSDAGWNLSMSFPQPGTRLIIETEDSRYPDDMCLWMLVGDEWPRDWNAWIYAYVDECGNWEARGTEWWWGHYVDWNAVTHSEVAPAPA